MLTTVELTLRRFLAIKPDATPYELFDVPEKLIGELNTLPKEHLEAQYASACSTIVKAARKIYAGGQPNEIGLLVNRWIVEQPGRWFLVARECRSFQHLAMPLNIVFPDLWVLQYGMATDCVISLDQALHTLRCSAAVMTLDGLRSPSDPAFNASLLQTMILPPPSP